MTKPHHRPWPANVPMVRAASPESVVLEWGVAYCAMWFFAGVCILCLPAAADLFRWNPKKMWKIPCIRRGWMGVQQANNVRPTGTLANDKLAMSRSNRLTDAGRSLKGAQIQAPLQHVAARGDRLS